MNLHEQMAADLDAVFFNLDEFACVHQIAGKEIKCIVDDEARAAQSGEMSDLSNVSSIGILQADRLVYCHASDLIPLPLPGQKLLMDNREWLVADSGVMETEGLLTLPLNRAY